MEILIGGPAWLDLRRRGCLCTVLDGGEVDIKPGQSYNGMGDFFQPFFRESSCLVWSGEAAT